MSEQVIQRALSIAHSLRIGMLPGTRATMFTLLLAGLPPALAASPLASGQKLLGECRDASGISVQGHIIRSKVKPAAIELCRAAVEQGPDQADAYAYLARAYWSSDRNAEAFAAAQRAAKAGSIVGMTALGVVYDYGIGVAADSGKAIQWYEKAALAGNAWAQNNLGQTLMAPDPVSGLPRDPVRGEQWIRKAAEQGYAQAMIRLGYIFASGAGVEKDASESFRWYLKAAELGDPVGQYSVGANFFSGQGVEKNLATAAQWFEKAAVQGHKDAQYWLGWLYYQGAGVDMDLGQARRWLSEAAGQGHALAISLLPALSPILRIEGGQHTAKINRISIDAQGRWLVTASDDKTARVWDVKTGRLEQVLRPSLGLSDEGKLFAASISPDGAQVAVAGWNRMGSDRGHAIFLFDRASGRLIQRLTGLPNVINELAFSPDGAYLAAGVNGPNGIRAWRTQDWREVLRDTAYGDTVYGLDFSPDSGRLVASSDDGSLRIYRRQGGDWVRSAKRTAPGGRYPNMVRFSPDGKLVAVGFLEIGNRSVDVLDGETLEHRFSPDTAGVSNGDLSAVAWLQAAEGVALAAAGRYYKGFPGRMQIRVWSRAGRGAFTDIPAGNNTVQGLLALPGGGLVHAWSAAWAVHAPRQVVVKTVPEPIADLRGGRAGYRLSRDGAVLRFGYSEFGRDPAIFDIANLRLDSSPTAVDRRDLSSPILKTAELNVTGWADNYSPKLNGQPLALKDKELARGLAIHPDNAGFVLGAEWTLRRFDRAGRQQWERPVPSIVRNINVSGNGRWVVVSYADGTIRWHNWSDGQEQLAFFPHADRKRWVLWTPEGYYAASPGGEELIGWHLNQGADKAARFISSSQLYDVFYRPDIVQAKFRGDDISKLVTLTAEEALKTPPPEIQFTVKPPDSNQAHTKVCYQIDSTGGGIGEVRLFQNGKLVKSDGFYRDASAMRGQSAIKLAAQTSEVVTRGVRLVANTPTFNTTLSPKGDRFTECQEIEALPGENEISVAAFNAGNTIQSGMASLRFYSTRKPEDPHLYVLAVGIDQFKDSSATLRYAAKDARDFERMIAEKAKGQYSPDRIHLTYFADQDASKGTLLGAIEKLSKQVKPGDTFILFVASHGIMLDGQYYLVTAGFNGTDDRDQLIGANEIVELSKQIRALSQLYIFDTCHAGGVDNIVSGLYDARMSVLAKKMGLDVYAAAGGLEEALDGYRGNGLFTHTLLASVNDPHKTDSNQDKRISIVELGQAASERTTAISSQLGHRQTPTLIHFGKDQTLFKVP